LIPAAALPYVPYIAFGVGTLIVVVGFVLAFRGKIQRRPVLLTGLVLAALPAVYVGLVWTRLLPESYIRFARPFLGLVAFPAMLFAALRLIGVSGRMGRARTVISDFLLTAALITSAVAAAGPELGRPLDRLSVIVVVDRSRSIDLVPAAATRVERELVVAEEGMRDEDRIGTVVFGTNAAVEDPLRPKSDVPTPQRVDLGRDGTDIAAGLKRALAEMPADTAGRIVLMSDGVPTRGDVMAAAAAAVASEIPIDVVVLEQREVADIRIVSVRMTPRANEDEMLSMRVVIASPADAEIELRILRDGELVRRIPAKVAAGEDVLRIREPAPTAGLHRYDVEITAKEAHLDESAEDNRASAFVRVRGPARALVLDGDPGKTTFMSHALREAGFRVDEGSTSSMPGDIGAMAGYDLIVFGDIAAKDLATRQLDALASYVRDLGGGLLLTGGDRSFGPGGYGRTPIEEISPVLFDLKQERRRASLAEVIAIDISGSMGMRVGSQTKLELANEAASRSASLLGTGDQLGVVHVDTVPHWAVPLGPVTDKAAIEKAIRSVGPGGGGILCDVALQEAYAALRKVNVNLKHVLLFADGSDAENITPTVQSWVSSAASSGITTSCISLGRGHHSPLLEDLSRRGGGRFYIVEDATRLPAVFAQETILASRSAIVERPFRVAPVAGHSATEGVDFGAAPELDGYVVTIAKPRSSVLLTGPDDDPILATWPAGIGRTAVFTSDFKDRWGADWTHWQGAARTLVQVARHISRREDDGRVRLEADTAGGQMHLRATVVDDDGRLQSFRRLTASVRGPDGFEHDVPLEAAGAGSYTATVPLAQPGAYIAVARDDVNGQAVSTTGAVLTAGEEMRPTGSDTALLTRIADLSGGQRRDTIAGIFAERADLRFAYRDITLPLLIAAAFALLLAVAARRLSLPENAFAKKSVPRRLEGEAAPAPDAKATLDHLLARQKDKTEERPAPVAVSEPSGPSRDGTGPPAPTAPPLAPTMAEQLAARRRAPRAPEPAQQPLASWSPTGWDARQPTPGDAPVAPPKAPAASGEPPPSARPLTAAEILLQKRKGKR
jgi:Ca-activated chloride channel homolog